MKLDTNALSTADSLRPGAPDEDAVTNKAKNKKRTPGSDFALALGAQLALPPQPLLLPRLTTPSKAMAEFVSASTGGEKSRQLASVHGSHLGDSIKSKAREVETGGSQTTLVKDSSSRGAHEENTGQKQDVATAPSSTQAPPSDFASHFAPGGPEASRLVPKLAAPIAAHAEEDSSLRVAVMQKAAHISVDTGANGDLSLHLRIREGVAELRVDGIAAPLLEAQAPDLRTALAQEGIVLGQIEITSKAAETIPGNFVSTSEPVQAPLGVAVIGHADQSLDTVGAASETRSSEDSASWFAGERRGGGSNEQQEQRDEHDQDSAHSITQGSRSQRSTTRPHKGRIHVKV